MTRTRDEHAVVSGKAGLGLFVPLPANCETSNFCPILDAVQPVDWAL